MKKANGKRFKSKAKDGFLKLKINKLGEKMSKFNFEYNEYVQGFVVSLIDDEEVNANLQYCNLDKEMLFGVDGGYISEGFTDDLLEEAYEEAQDCEMVMDVEGMFREVWGGNNKEKFESLRASQGCLSLSDLEELAGQ